jgi:hypothetical protein
MSPTISTAACWREASGSSRFTSAPDRPITVRVLVIWKICPVAGPWMTASENRRSVGSCSRPILWASPPVIVAEPVGGDEAAGAGTGVSRVRRASGAGGDGAASGGGIVIAPWSGFSISIVPPHFAHRVLAFARSPSFDSSNR